MKENNKKNYWHSNWFIKRINNFAVYMVSALLSLINPEMVDTVLYTTLKEQFEERK